MSEKNNPSHPPIPDYVTRSHEVLEIEMEQYLKKRRAANGIEEAPDKDNLKGLCISGGGVRSATLGLGMLQAFIKAGKMKYFDYLSTVSGGGYIGACLSSLLSAEPDRRDKSWENTNGEPVFNKSTKFNVEDYGLDEANSPFTNETYEYPKLGEARMNTRHQLIHLRQHGEYLTPHKSIRDWDVHRLLGALFGGVVTNVSVFLLLLTVVVLLHHFLLAVMSGDCFVEKLQNPVPIANQLIKEQYDQEAAHCFEDSLVAISHGHAYKRPPQASLDTFTTLDTAYPDESWQKLSAAEQLSAWAQHRFAPQLSLVWLGVWKHWPYALFFVGLGFLFAMIFLVWARQIPERIIRYEQDEQNFTGTPPDDIVHPRRSDQDMLDMLERPLIKWFYHLGLWGVPLIAYLLTAYLTYQYNSSINVFVMLALPFCYSFGLYAGLHLWIYLFLLNHGKEIVSGWLYRSFYNGLQGGALLMVLLSISFPVAIILLFGDHGLAVRLSFSFLPVITAYIFTMQSLGARIGGGDNSFLMDIGRRIQTPLLNLSIFLFVGLAFAWISKALFSIEESLLNDALPFLAPGNPFNRTMVIGGMFLLSFLLLILLGFIMNSNDISLHYFYRDRLSEAYLRTIGRVETPDKGSLGGKKLQRVTLRNHEDLRLYQLGERNFKAPYHIIVTALNLQGSHDLSAKTQKSEHFIFSKFFVGSRSTGYAATHAYYHGSTKLSTAMAISAAAVSAGMGPIGFAASNFYMTLLNLRTGYWVDNPRHFIKRKVMDIRQKQAENPEKSSTRRWPRWTFKDRIRLWWEHWTNEHPFWLRYVGKELTGNLSSSSQKVYVSDGGHTGDNLGLLPLIQRRCSTIVIADFEEDGTFSFNSFNQAVRLAKSVYNADISIDLSKIQPIKSETGVLFSPDSVAVGEITYHFEEPFKDEESQTTGRRLVRKKATLIYMKSSVSLLKEQAEVNAEVVPAPPMVEQAPVFVLNYFKRNPKFPHQSTADQYFDEVQFEAYRMLGEHIGSQAAKRFSV